MRQRALVFDFDGVLVDSEAVHGRSLARAAGALGMVIRESCPDWYVGLGDRECFERIASVNERVCTEELLAELVALKAAAFSQASSGGAIRPYPGAFELLRDAAEQGPVAVCSGSHRRDLEPILRRHGVWDLLATLVTADDVRRTKPDPEPYVLTASRLGLKPSDCVAIEDSPAGIAAAVAAGYRVHAVCHTFSRDRLSEAGSVHACIADVRPLVLRA